MTYGEIFNKFLEDTNIANNLINDYRPCTKMYGVPNISNAIVVWLNNGNKIIYIVGEKYENTQSY